MTSITMSFDIEERRDGWRFRFPAEDETAPWSKTFPNRASTEAAAVKAVEEHLAKAVASAFGIA